MNAKPALVVPDPTIEERLLSHLIVDDNECWLWTGKTDSEGYARIMSSPNRRAPYIHRLSYELFIGPVPEGLVLDHICRRRSCANPNHVEPVKQVVNVARGKLVGRTHCKRGHEFTRENTIEKINPNTGNTLRNCRTCQRFHQRAYKLRIQKKS